MPSSSARCAQLPRAADKIPFFSALKDLRDKIKSWSGGLSSGGRLVPLEEVNGNIFPDHVDLELTRLYDAGKSNYSTDRAEKKRKANALNGGNQTVTRANNLDDSSRSSQNMPPQQTLGLQNNYFDPRSEKQKLANSQRSKDDRLPNIPNHNFFMSGQNISPNNGQWVPGTFYNSSFSYQPYMIDSSQYSPSQQQCRFPTNPIFRPNMLPTSLPHSLSNPRNYSVASNQNSLSSSDERTENSFDTSSFTSENMQLHNSTDSSEKNESSKINSKDEFDSQPQQSSTNFVSLLMSDSLSLPDSPCDFDKTMESRCIQPILTCSWQNSDNIPSSDPISCNSHNTFWEHNNNILVSSYFSARRQLPQEHPMYTVFSNLQGNNTNFSDINSDNHYQTSFSMSSFYSSPHSITGGTNSIASVQSPLSSDQVTSSLCSVKVTPDSTSLANRKRSCFDLSDTDYLPNKLMIPDDNSTSGHDQVTYTDL